MASGRLVTRVVLPLAARHLAQRALLMGIAVLALASGVATVTATQLLHRSVVESYEATVRRLAGTAAFEVGNGESGVPETLLDALRGVPGVRDVVASVEGFVPLPDMPGERLYLYGVDLLADQAVRDYGTDSAVVSDPMVFLAAPDSVALTEAFVRDRGLAMGDRVRVRTPAGVVTLTVRATLGRQTGPASALDGRIAVVDLSVAQRLLRLEGRVSRLALAIDADADPEDVRRRAEVVVGARGVVEPPRARAATFARLLTSHRNGLLLAAMVAVLVALQFVANVATVAVEERRREMALLRAIGASSWIVGALLMGEMLLLGVGAALLGLPVGIEVARLLLDRFAEGVGALYGDVGPAALHVDAATLALSAACGVCTAVAAAFPAFRRVLHVGPVEALRPVLHSNPGGTAFRAELVGVAVAGVALLLWNVRDHVPLSTDAAGMTAIVGVSAGIALVLPGGMSRAARALEWLVRGHDDVTLVLAARWIAEERRRLAVSCAAMTMAIGGSIAVASWISSLAATLHEAFDGLFGRVDVVVSGGADPFARDAVRMPAALADELAAWSDIAFVDALRVDTIDYGGSRAAIVARDAAAYVEGRRKLVMVDGDAGSAARRLATGSGVVVNSTFARRFGRRLGDELELATPSGALRLPIVGIHLELTPGDLGVVQVDRELYRRWWRDDSVSLVEIGLRRPEDVSRVAAELRTRWGARHALVVFAVEELRRSYAVMLDRLAALVKPLLALALGCGLAGLVGASTAAVLVRRRTYALLRAVGCSRRQVMRATWLELATVGGGAVLTALVLGAALGWLQVEVLLRGMLGLSVEFAFPRDLATAAALAVATVVAFAGRMLGRSAGRTPIGALLHAE